MTETAQLESQARLLHALQEASLYDHAVTGFELIQTHISWVLLTGNYVYKIKKAVDFGFLDYSTLELRRTQCLEELRLNRRTAPELYLDVIAITGSAEQPVLNGDGPPIEYAVKMRQFPQQALLSRMLERDELHTEQISALAATIAAFHARVDRAAADSAFGAPAAVFHPVQENFDQIRGLIKQAQLLARLGALETWSRNSHLQLEELIRRRRREGFVRDCHGDLHLNNVAWLDGHPVLFDCIEFNPSLRIIDVFSELAFILMDLEEHQRADLANRLLNDYLAQTGDYQGMGVLRFYKVYRAMVRAKVASLRLAQNGITEKEIAAVQQGFSGYLDLAEHYIAPPRPRLLITRGLSGSGKSTVARAMCETMGAIQLRSDVERKRLFGMTADQSSASTVGGGIYTREATAKTYATLLTQSGVILDAGYTVIVDATFLEREQRDAFRQLAERLHVAFNILDIQAPHSVLRERIEQRHQRGSDASEADLAVLEAQLKKYRGVDRDEQPCTLIIDSGSALDVEQLHRQLTD